MPFVQSLVFLVLSFVLGLVACVAKPRVPPLEFHGTVLYRERIALEPGSTVEVELVDASRADAPATVLARAERVVDGEQVPVPFDLSVERERLAPGGLYLLQARIRSGDRVLFTSSETVRASTERTSGIELLVRSGDGRETSARPERGSGSDRLP